MDWYKEVLKVKENIIKDLFGLMKIKSIKDLKSSSKQKPMGEGIAEALDYMLSLAERDGFTVKNIDGYAGYAELGNKQNNEDLYAGILCHLDVVPATGEWESDPFSPVIKNDRIFGRGAIDDKGPTIAVYYALKILKELDLPIKRNIRIIFGTDEESGMRCMKYYNQTEPMPEIGFAPDAVFPIIHAEKGQINAKLTFKESKTKKNTGLNKVVKFVSGNKGNMVPEKAMAIVFAPDTDIEKKFDEFCKRKQLDGKVTTNGEEVEIILYGKSAHGMNPSEGINAGLTLASFLHKEGIMATNQKAYFEFLGVVLYNDHDGEQLGINFEDDYSGKLTVNPGVMELENNEGSLQLNIRCPVNTPYFRTIEIIEEKIKDYFFSLESVREKKPHFVNSNEPLIKVLQEAYQDETGLEPSLLSTGGATYARFIKRGVAFGAVFPGKKMTAHQANEYIEMEDLLKATAIYARAIYGLANMEERE
ncbi:dipeptidase PepV [Pseudalkalibacillus caeni]|uniref:Dipeptidase PepV n=1 Tax=Exobacillus caeni TaxID=2574798 RepID=A0A5R9F7Y2_9BACL|nr:dipeptidase PepV [Pseudalkalibacillus caeni]TLS38629.1 dipeptidase PepV [Pseudalkalibacillus caeni]